MMWPLLIASEWSDTDADWMDAEHGINFAESGTERTDCTCAQILDGGGRVRGLLTPHLARSSGNVNAMQQKILVYFISFGNAQGRWMCEYFQESE
jgi:hypothetical protein